MGLLDDAIRQHLELKRQHGAPEEELQRQEEEALGPARRDVAPAETTRGDGEVELEAADDAVAADAASEQETELFDHDVAEEPALEEREDAFDEPRSALDEPEGESPAGFDERAAGFDAPASEPTSGPDVAFEPDEEPGGEGELEGVPEPADMPPSPAPFDADAAFEGFSEQSEAGEDEEEPEGRQDPDRDESDVLEDTPDFLQETPEHDRLWFEQKPPRDFDFD
jgi:hypothetical protein